MAVPNASIRHRKLYYHYKWAKRCVKCGQPSMPGKTRCGDCLEKMRATSVKIRERYKSTGRCPRCGAIVETQSRITCANCADRKITEVNHAPKYSYSTERFRIDFAW